MAAAEAGARRDVSIDDPLIGTVVNGRFHIVKRIARGGMGSVYFATQAPLSRPVAVKVLRTVRNGDSESDESFRRRFLLEASILAKLQHPNIVMLLDYGQISNSADEHYFMAMEYLRGETLAQRFRTRGRLSIVESLRLARQIGRGLREAHRCGFVHRDLKPSNIMLVPDDERSDIVKLVDFGIGKIISGRTDLVRDNAAETRAGLLLGSPRYMAPEQIRSEPVEPRTDLYGLGVTLFEALTGRVPFEGSVSFDVMVAHCQVRAPLLPDACPTEFYPASLVELVDSLLEKHPSGRPTVEEFLQLLTAVEEEIFRSVTLTMPASATFTPVSMPSAAPLSHRRSFDRITLPPVAFVPPPPPEVGHTTRPSFSTLSPLPPPPGKRALALRAVAALAILGLCIFVGRCAAVGLLGQPISVLTRAGAVRARVPAQASSLPGSDAASVAVGAAERELGSLALTIDSTPEGATVTEDGKPVGVTPVTITVDRAALRSAPVRFLLSRAGYSPYILEQGDSETPAHVQAVLVAAPPLARKAIAPWAAVASTRANGAPDHRATLPPSLDGFRAKHDDGSGLDIRLRR